MNYITLHGIHPILFSVSIIGFFLGGGFTIGSALFLRDYKKMDHKHKIVEVSSLITFIIITLVSGAFMASMFKIQNDNARKVTDAYGISKASMPSKVLLGRESTGTLTDDAAIYTFRIDNNSHLTLYKSETSLVRPE